MNGTVNGHYGVEGMVAIIQAYERAPADADIEFRVGHVEGDDEPLVICTVHMTTAGLTPRQARGLADSFESSMHTFAGNPEVAGFPDMILALRATADRADQQAA